MSRLGAFRRAVGKLFGSAFFLIAAFATMGVWLIVLALGFTGSDISEYGVPLAMHFPIDVSEYQLHPLIPENFNKNIIYGVQCGLMVLLVFWIWSYQYFQAEKAYEETVLTKLMIYTISIKFVVFYGFILPTILFFLNCSQLTDERNGVVELHDIQLFVLDQFFRSVLFDILEAMKINISGLDYAEDSDLGFRLLVTIYRLSVPMWVFLVWRRVRAPKAPKPEPSAQADSQGEAEPIRAPAAS